MSINDALQSAQPNVRLGLNRVKGIGLKAAGRIVEARKTASFESTSRSGKTRINQHF